MLASLIFHYFMNSNRLIVKGFIYIYINDINVCIYIFAFVIIFVAFLIHFIYIFIPFFFISLFIKGLPAENILFELLI